MQGKSNGVLRHIFDRYLWGDDAIPNMREDLAELFSDIVGLSWMGSPWRMGEETGPDFPTSLFIVGVLLALAAPRLLSRPWRALRVAFFNRPGTVFMGYARREGSRLSRWWLADRPVFQHVSDRLRVSRLVGGIGSGKTTAMLHLIKQDLRAGLPVVIIEVSGDLGKKAREYAALYETPCYHFDPADPGAYKLNPLAGPQKEQIASRFVDVVCGDYATREQYFKQVNEVLSFYGVIAVKCYEDDHLAGEATIEHLIKFIVNEEYRKQALLTGKDESNGRITVNAPWLDPAARDFYESIFYNYWTSEQRRAHTVGMTNALLVITAGTEFREALCPMPGEPRLRLAEAIEEGALIVLRSPVDIGGANSAATLAGWHLGSFEQLTESRHNKRFVSLYLDEAHLILSQNNYLVAQRFKVWVPLVRHYHVIVTFAYQSFSMLEYGLGRMLTTLARNTLTFGAGLGHEDAEEAQSVAGAQDTEVHDHRRARRRFIPLKVLSSFDESDMVGTRNELRPRYGADEIRAMKPGRAIATLTKHNRFAPPVHLRIPREGWLVKKADVAQAALRNRARRALHIVRAAAVAALREAAEGGARSNDGGTVGSEGADARQG